MKHETIYLLQTTKAFLQKHRKGPLYADQRLRQLRRDMHLAEQAWADAGCPDAEEKVSIRNPFRTYYIDNPEPTLADVRGEKEPCEYKPMPDEE